MAFLDPDAVRRAAAAAPSGPLHGLPLGVKDVLDTADMPSEYNSPIWRGHRPRADAACVAAARAAGAVVIGKTVTTEFAVRTPGPTTNPANPAHTPGGSSSGSAAGVAAQCFPLAFGTQTAGSIIRPAAFCGAVGYKPSFATINRAGLKIMCDSSTRSAPSPAALPIARCWSVPLPAAISATPSAIPAARRASAFAAARAGPPPSPKPHRCSIAPWRAARRGCHRHRARAARRARSAGRGASGRAVGGERTGVGLGARDAPRCDQPGAARIARSWRRLGAGGSLDAARAAFRAAQEAFGPATAALDVLLTPAAPGEAPAGLGWTGDPIFNYLWTSLHVPCVTVPAGVGPAGLPLGVQIVGRRGEDRATLAWAQWVAAALG